MKFFKHDIRWLNSAFLIGTFLTTITAVPWYLWAFGLNGFQIVLFLFFFISTGLSITLGYHRLFSHLTFQASWPVKVFTLLFGAAAFEGSALSWCADHRRHHKFVDHDEDPYDITKGFFHAHIGWLLFRTGPDTPLTWVRDLQKDKLAWWQHEYYVPISLGISFALPAAIGWAWGGPTAALGGFLLAGVARTVVVHHMTFCINSLCHWIGDRPYSGEVSARDSVLMALFTFGEGYHNFHHEFQNDYRNGVKHWQFDPTKWTIWLLNKIGLVWNLRTVPEERILKAQLLEHERRLRAKLVSRPPSDPVHEIVETGRQRVNEAVAHWEQILTKYREALAAKHLVAQEERREIKRNLRNATDHLRRTIRQWMDSLRALPDSTTF